MIKLTQEQRAVLAHVVIDPDDWVKKAVAGVGLVRAQAALEAKVNRWKPDYLAAVKRGNYQTRAQRGD